MPIHKMSFEDGIFFTRFEGYVDHIDANTWADTLLKYANDGDTYVVTVLDMLHVDQLCPTFMDMSTKVLKNNRILSIDLVISNTASPRNTRVFNELRSVSAIRIFDTLNMAMMHANSQLYPSIFSASNSTQMSCVVVGI